MLLLYSDTLLALLVGFFIELLFNPQPLNIMDMTPGQERYLKMLEYEKEEARKELVENAGIIETFQQHCERKGITLTSENFSYIPRIGIVAKYPNIVGLLNEELLTDKDGLHKFAQLTKLYNQLPFPGYLSGEGGNFMLMAHPHFRRGYDDESCFAPSFIERFWKLRLPNIKPLIALDTNRIRINMDYKMFMEFDMWQGARFKEDVASIPDGIVQLRPPLGIDEMMVRMFFADTELLDIKWATAWSAKDNQYVKSFYAEEFKTINETIEIDGTEFLPAKYIHAEYLMDSGHFKHLDGAIHFYTYDDYEIRIGADLNYNDKNDYPIKAEGIKLFRIDGVIDVATWIEFTSHFFTGDPLILEYFEGKMPDRIQKVLTDMKNFEDSED